MSGYYSIPRELEMHPRRKDVRWWSILTHLLAEACYQEGTPVTFNGKVIHLKRGQLITSRKRIAGTTGIPEMTVQKVLKRMEEEQVIEQQTCNKSRLITVSYYVHPTEWEQQKEQLGNIKGTSGEHQGNTSKKDKKDKKDKNPPGEEEDFFPDWVVRKMEVYGDELEVLDEYEDCKSYYLMKGGVTEYRFGNWLKRSLANKDKGVGEDKKNTAAGEGGPSILPCPDVNEEAAKKWFAEEAKRMEVKNGG